MDYWVENEFRSLQDIRECAMKNQFSCQHKPLLHIKLENVVLDELHLMLRITGIIIFLCLYIMQDDFTCDGERALALNELTTKYLVPTNGERY